MSDLISRADTIKVIRECRPWHFCELVPILSAIKDIPAAEPKSGEWITFDTEVISVPVYLNEEQRQSDKKGAGIQEKCKCSVCGWRTNFMGYKKLGVNKSFNFCPNCGAIMKEADDGK